MLVRSITIIQSWSLSDQSFLSFIGQFGSGEFTYPSGVAVDHDRYRIIIVDRGNHRVQVLSLIDGSFLFEFGSRGNQPGEFSLEGLCIDNQGRIIVAEPNNHRLQSFTHEGHHSLTRSCRFVSFPSTRTRTR